MCFLLLNIILLSFLEQMWMSFFIDFLPHSVIYFGTACGTDKHFTWFLTAGRKGLLRLPHYFIDYCTKMNAVQSLVPARFLVLMSHLVFIVTLFSSVVSVLLFDIQVQVYLFVSRNRQKIWCTPVRTYIYIIAQFCGKNDWIIQFVIQEIKNCMKTFRSSS